MCRLIPHVLDSSSRESSRAVSLALLLSSVLEVAGWVSDPAPSPSPRMSWVPDRCGQCEVTALIAWPNSAEFPRRDHFVNRAIVFALFDTSLFLSGNSGRSENDIAGFESVQPGPRP